MEIELPNGQIAEFPDDMPQEHIQSVLQNHFKPAKATESDKSQAFEMIKQQHPGMPEFLIKALMPAATKMAETPADTSPGTATGAFYRSLVRAPLEGAENFAQLVGLPVDKQSKWPGLIAESESDKSHPLAQLGGSLAGLAIPGAGAVRAMRAIPAWGNIAKNASGSLLRKLPVYGAEGAALGAGLSAEGERLEGAALGGALGGAGAAIPSAFKGLGALKGRISSLRNLDKLKSEGKITEQQYSQAVSEEQALQDLMKQKGMGSNVGELESELPTTQKMAEDLAIKLQQTPEINTKNMLGAPEGENLVPQAQELLNKSQVNSEGIGKSISEHLGIGEAHDVRVAKQLKSMIEENKSDIGKIYNDVHSDLKGTNVELPRGREIKQITNDIQKAIKEGGYGSKEVEELAKELESASKGRDIVSGDNFLAMYRSTRDLANKASQNSRKTGIDAIDRQHWEKQAKELTATSEKMNNILEKHMSKESYAKLKEANHRWRTEITPLYKNKLYYQITKDTRLPKDIINELRGEGEGQQILRSMIKKNPEALKNVLGQKYAKNPAKLHEFDELSHEYVQQSPELLSLKNQHAQSLKLNELNKTNLSKAQERANAMKSEAERVKTSYGETVKEQELRTKQKQELDDTNKKIADMQRYIPELKKKAVNKNISLKQKVELESKISKAEKDVAKLKKHLSFLGLGTLAYAAGASGLISGKIPK